MSGLKRNISSKINELQKMFPVVVILGVRQCGKTFLAKQLRPKWKYVDLEDSEKFDQLTLDPKHFLKQNPQHVIFDEAQKAPQLFSTLRGVIDEDRNEKNRFLITGSSSPELLRQVSNSLAGRAALVELGTLKVNEVKAKPMSSFYDLFKQKITSKSLNVLLDMETELTGEEFEDGLLFGGYPEPVIKENHSFYRQWMDQYFELYINRDVRSLFPRLDLVKYQRFIKMLASLAGQLINKAELARSLDISETTAKEYLDVAHGTFVWRNTFSYQRDHSKSLLKMPRGGFRDTGLLNHLKGIYDQEALRNFPYVGRVFENFVCEEIIKGVQSTMATSLEVHYFRTKNGAEIDLIVSGDFGVLPIKIKYGTKIDTRKLKSLEQFIDRHHLEFGILVNNSSSIEMLTPKIIQVPVYYL